MQILSKSTTRCLTKNAVSNNGGPFARIFDQFLREETLLYAFSSLEGDADSSEERERASG